MHTQTLYFLRAFFMMTGLVLLSACSGGDGTSESISSSINTSINTQENNHTTILDSTKPVITLFGEATVTLTVGDIYTDSGATATDDKDGDITANIVTTGSVDTTAAGTYTLRYNVSDAAGNAADTVTRTVIVNEVPNVIPVIEGTPKERVAVYETYRFLPIASDADGDTLTFSVQNKPSWAEFNKSTGLLEGVPTSERNYSNIIISVSDGADSVSLAPFTITVNPAIDIAHKFGKATQGTNDTYYWYLPAEYVIDNNDSTNNHTSGGADGKNWLQIELPNPTVIHKIVLQAKAYSSRITNAKVYISDTSYTGTVDENDYIQTLVATLDEQIITLDTPISGRYLLIKGEVRPEDDRHIHLFKVEVYGTIIETEPFIANSELNTTIGRYRDTVTPILTIDGKDYQDDVLYYTIVQNSLPFRIDENGTIYVDGLLPEDSYVFDVNVSDGLESVITSVRVDVVDKMEVETYYTWDRQPALTAYFPNTYQSGDNFTVTINGQTYTPNIDISTGIWSIVQGEISPKLEIGDYNIYLNVGDNAPILFENYFSVLGENTQSQAINITISNTIEDINVSITSATSAPLPKGKIVRATDQNLSKEAGETILYNDSYRTIHSLIATYTDNSNQKHFFRLIFNQDIEPYSRNVIDWTNDNNATIFHTAGQYNLQVSFGGEDCNTSTNDVTIYCTPTTRDDVIYSASAVQEPTLSEQQVFTKVTATWNHIYNRVAGIKSIDAYVNRETYDGMDFSDTYQGSDSYATGATKEAFFAKRFFASFSPNNATEYMTMRYVYAAEGMAGLPNSFSTTGEIAIGAWASLWEGSLRLQEEDGSFRSSPYEYIHHEAQHSHGMNHDSGLTYGWPNQARKLFVEKYYPNAKVPSVNAPKYIFETKILDKNNLELTLHKTSDAQDSNLTFEVFAGIMWQSEDINFTQLSENRVRLMISDAVFPRFFIRVYGDDSDEFMSQFITPKDMVTNSFKVGSDINNNYYLISRTTWDTYADLTNYTVDYRNNAEPICKILLASPNAKLGDKAMADEIDTNLTRTDVETVLEKNSQSLYFGAWDTWWKSAFYDFTNTSYSSDVYVDYYNQRDRNVSDYPDVGLMCTEPIE